MLFCDNVMNDLREKKLTPDHKALLERKFTEDMLAESDYSSDEDEPSSKPVVR